MAVQMKIIAIGAVAINAISVGAVPLKGAGNEKKTKVVTSPHKSKDNTLGASVGGTETCWYPEIQAPSDACDPNTGECMIACPGRGCSNNNLNMAKGQATKVDEVKTCTVASHSSVEEKIKSVWSCANFLCDQINKKFPEQSPPPCAAAIATFHKENKKDDAAPSWGKYEKNDAGMVVCTEGCVTHATLEFYKHDFYPENWQQGEDIWHNWTKECKDDCHFEGPHCKGDTGVEKVTYYFAPHA